MTSTLLYNALMLALDIIFLLALVRWRSLRVFIWGTLSIIACTGILAVVFNPSGFGTIRLFAFGVFGHILLVFIGAAWVLKNSFRKTAIASTCFAGILAFIAVDVFLIEPYWLQVSTVRIHSKKIKKPLTIAIVADIQTDVIGKYEKRVFREIMKAKPDMILLVGDYIQEADSKRREELYRKCQKALQDVSFSAPEGVYAIAGNVDFPDWNKAFGDTAIIISKTRTIELDDILVTGLSRSDSFSSRFVLDKNTEKKRTNKFHIVFGHSPNFALGKVSADLLVAGHTHGGQVQLPFIGPLMTLSKVPRQWASGVTKIGNGRTLIVSRGVGMERGDAPRMRFLCRPELVLVQLKPQ